MGLHGQSVFEAELPMWDAWLHRSWAHAAEEKSYFVTMTFNRYRDYYLLPNPGKASEAGLDQPVSKIDVLTGLARKLPADTAARELVADVNRWYLRLLNALCGGRYGDHRQLHPKAVGFLDDPVQKGRQKGQQKRLPGDRFRHAHLVMTVTDAPCPHKGVDMISEFERLWRQGGLELMWKRFNCEGELHVQDAYDTAGAIDYAAKSAKRSADYQDNMILLPFRHQ
jgi:hypothetical protein